MMDTLKSVPFAHNALIPELSVSSIEKSLSFYVDILQFTLAYQRKNEGFAFLLLGETQLMLDEIDKGRTWKTDELIYPFGRGLHLQIKVNSIDSLLNRLNEHCIELFMQPEIKWYATHHEEIGHKQFLVMDPDGYLLRFIEIIGSRSFTRNEIDV